MSTLKNHIKIARRNSFITPRLHGWLAKNDGVKITTEEIGKRVAEILAPTTGNRSGVFHPSQLYQCKRSQIFDFLDVPVVRAYNPTLQNLFNDGHFRHLRWQIMLLSAGILTDVEVPVSIPKYRISGSMDGMNKDEGWMFELKGTSQFRQVETKGPMPVHSKQVQTYLWASGLERCVIVYECKSSQRWIEAEVPKDAKVAADIEAILQELNSTIDGGPLPEILNDCKNQTGTQYNNCPHSTRCLATGKNTTAEEITASLQIRGRRAPAKRGSAGTR